MYEEDEVEIPIYLITGFLESGKTSFINFTVAQEYFQIDGPTLLITTEQYIVEANYISALGFWNEQYNDFDKFWPADVHMVAKDIMRFHAIIWPAMLMALDLPLPKHLAVHGWITFNGQKMSKSLGNVVDPFILGERYGADAIRYHILREMALGADSSFSNEIMINRINSDLANFSPR